VLSDLVALNRSTVVSAGQKLGLIGGARADKAFARATLRQGRLMARSADDLKKGVVEYRTHSPSFARGEGELAFRDAINSGRNAARAGVKSAEAEKLAIGEAFGRMTPAQRMAVRQEMPSERFKQQADALTRPKQLRSGDFTAMNPTKGYILKPPMQSQAASRLAEAVKSVPKPSMFKRVTGALAKLR
jgi:hypothetical protein